MAVHVVVGASRGIGYALVKHFAADPSNTVIGIVRDVPATLNKLSTDTNIPSTTNIHILPGELTSPVSLFAAATAASPLTPTGAVDYLWNNAAYMHPDQQNTFLSEYSTSPALLDDFRLGFETNVLGTIHVFNAFLPLVLKPTTKKVITLGTGFTDNALTSEFGIWEASAYSVEKAAVNTIVAKYDARYREQGVLFVSIAPGIVDTGGAGAMAESELPEKFLKYAPKSLKILTPEESVEHVWRVADECTLDTDGGRSWSHLGRHQRWL